MQSNDITPRSKIIDLKQYLILTPTAKIALSREYEGSQP